MIKIVMLTFYDYQRYCSYHSYYYHHHPLFPPAKVPHGESPARDSALHKLFTTGLINLPKPRLPRTPPKPPSPRAISNKDDLVGRIILWEMSHVPV